MGSLERRAGPERNFFSDNTELCGGNRFSQAPIYAVEG